MEANFSTYKNILFIAKSLRLRKNRGPPKTLHVTVKALSSYKSGINEIANPPAMLGRIE